MKIAAYCNVLMEFQWPYDIAEMTCGKLDK